MDDESIEDNNGLLRRVPNWPNMTKFCQNTKSLRLTSACFRDRSTNDHETSVTLENELLESGGTHADAAKIAGFGLARIEAGFVRNELSNKQNIRRDPVKDDEHHALIVGNKTKSDLRKMACEAELVIMPQEE